MPLRLLRGPPIQTIVPPLPSAGRDQYAVKLESLISAEQGDFELPAWKWPGYLGGFPKLAGDADAQGVPGVVGPPDGRRHRRHIGSGHGDHESVRGGLCRVAWGAGW